MPDLFSYEHPSEKQADREGPLSDLRVVVQPNLSVRGWPCEAGSRALAGYRALFDATAVSRLTRAGALCVGASRMAELGFGLAGDTTARTLLQGHADLALVTDTMGEARAAAAMNGLFGFKPSWGLVSRFGLVGTVPSMECVGMMAADPAIMERALSAMTGADPEDPSMPEDCLAGLDGATSPEAAMTAGVDTAWLEGLDAGKRRSFDAALEKLSAAGVVVRSVSLPPQSLFRDAHQVIAAVEASSSAGKYDGVRYGHRSPAGKNWNEMYLNTRGESFGLLVKAFLFQGAWFQFETYAAFEDACRIRGALLEAVNGLFGEVDLLAIPALGAANDPAQAATIEATYAAFGFTLAANVTGHPALQVPGAGPGTSADTGLQLVGRRLEDTRLLTLALRLASVVKEVK